MTQESERRSIPERVLSGTRAAIHVFVEELYGVSKRLDLLEFELRKKRRARERGETI